MFQLGKTLISEDILEKDFVCNLNACKGACCIDGEAGAPLSEKETILLDEIYPKVKPFMRAQGIAAIEAQGASIITEDGDLETPLIGNADCAYVTVDKNGTALCAIEEAFNEGVIDFKKPISCHLYPVRVNDYSEFSAVNYHKWSICSEACTLGEELGVPVYKFVKDALIRKFGQDWYAQLEKVAAEIKAN